MDDVRSLIRRLAQDGSEIYCKICTVDKVYEESRSADVTPIDESAPILGVNLQASQESDKGLVVFPKEGSYVVVAFISEAVAAVVLTDEIDKTLLTIGDTSLEIVDGSITINGGELGGLVVYGKLKESLDSLKSYCESLKTAIAAGITAVGIGTAANGTTGAQAFNQQMAGKTISISADMENDKIKH